MPNLVKDAYLANEFVISAGCVPLKPLPRSDLGDTSPRLPTEYTLVYIYNRRSKVRHLAKGRKDIGESIVEAALRETFEETGYKCSGVLPMPTPTLAPFDSSKPKPALNTEPVAVRLWIDTHSRKAEGIKVQKFIHWYVAEVDTDETGETVPRVEGTQLPYEQYDVNEMPLEQACREEDGLSHRDDRRLIAFVQELLLQRHRILTQEGSPSST